ncbi:epoxide hydrolase [Daedaleopsis nitida]|nr:epoxide hydrolase [Daedaleopsis nitida]
MSHRHANETSFKLAVPDADLELLQRKLALTRFPDELDGAGWQYGVPLAHIKRLSDHWKDGFDWRKAEAKINELPMFTRDIEVEGHGTLNIHYVHQKSQVENAIPLLFVHGWPGHFLEVRKLLPLLTTGSSPEHPSFHVVALSLPGFGFSEAPRKPGFRGPQYAEVFNKLMLSLGYSEYVYQGGDYGHMLGRHAINNYAYKHIKAWHTNTPIVDRVPPNPLTNLNVLWSMLTLPFNKETQRMLETGREFDMKGRGYLIEQATRPQTLGYSLADSPVGLLAWIYEKLVAWSDTYPWTDDEVLEWISIYWFSRAGPAASVRIYYEMTEGGTRSFFHKIKWTSIPLGLSYFPKELVVQPKSWMSILGNVVLITEHDKGGHFGAFERPEELAGDLRQMFGRTGKAYGVVPGKSGY